MSYLPPFSLASNPAKTITLREATVEECIDFAGVDRNHEEEITTIFLNRLQDKASFLDAKKWTADDRRLGIFWYWRHTARDLDFHIPTSYPCQHCGEDHHYLADYRRLDEGYRQITGLPEREVEFKGEKLTVRPLNGEDMEALELLWLELRIIREKHGEESGKHGKKEAEIKLEEVCRAIGWTTEKAGTLNYREYAELTEKVNAAQAEMVHGLESVYEGGSLQICLPPHQCPNATDKEAITRLWVTFRLVDYLPKI